MFHNILIPVNPGRSTKSAIEKAVEFANQLECHLHLLHIIEPPAFPFTWLQGYRQTEKDRGNKLLEWRSRYAKRLKPGLRLFAAIQDGDPAKLVARYAEINEIDMVLTEDQPGRFLFFTNKLNAGQLSRRTNCPILTIKPSPGHQPFKIIVLPVGRFIPVNKVRIAICLAKQFKAAIHLLALEKHGKIQEEELNCMKKTFRVLKDNTDIPVACNTLAGESLLNLAKKYAHSLGAGLVVVNPGAESQLSGSPNHLFSGSVLEESKVPVITVV